MAEQDLIPVDSTKSPEENLLAAINAANDTNVSIRGINFGQPQQFGENDPRDTVIDITAVSGFRYSGGKEYRYKRLDLSHYRKVLTSYAIEYLDTITTLKDQFMKRLDLVLTDVDIEGEFIIGETLSIVAKPDSLLYVGRLDIPLLLGGAKSLFGSSELVGGGVDAGYFGEVDPTDFITSTTLAQECGVHSLINENFGTTIGYIDPNMSWLKFIRQGKVLYIAKQMLAADISWDDLDSRGLVFGQKTITLDGETFKVRLMKGSEDPYDYTDDDYDHSIIGHTFSNGSTEWTDLIWRVCADSPRDAGLWDSFTQGQLSAGIPEDENHPELGGGLYGFEMWCQEYDRDYTSNRLKLGRDYTDGINYMYSMHSSARAYGGWRPVLELVTD